MLPGLSLNVEKVHWCVLVFILILLPTSETYSQLKPAETSLHADSQCT